jgi:hypothetical protein
MTEDNAGWGAFCEAVMYAMEKKDDITIQSEHPL